MWRAYTGVIHCVFGQIPNLQICFITPKEGASDTCRQVPLLVNFSEKPTFIGFGVFIDIWSMNETHSLLSN